MEELLNCSALFAMSTTINHSVISIINHSRKSLHFDKTSAWVKKRNNYLFDVTMGSYDGVEICEIVGLYLLNRSSTVIDKSCVDLHWVDQKNTPKI